MRFLNFNITRASRQYEKNRWPMLPRWTSPPTRNTQEWMDTFGKNPRLSVVDKIATDLSYVQGKLYRIDDSGERKELKDHPFLDFWKSPNPLHEFTASALWRLSGIYLYLKGEAYFIIERYTNGWPAELWAVPPQWVQMTPYQGYPFYKIRTSTGEMMEVSVDDMFVMKDLNPLNPYERGLGQAEALADEIEIDEYAAKFQKKFFYNDATPDLLISMPGATKEQQETFLERWRQRLQGVRNSHGIATISGKPDAPVNVTKLADNMKDLDMVNGRQFIRDAVMEHFGMPREIMGITQNSNRATAEAAQYIYAFNVLTPKIKNRQDAINQQILPAYGDDLFWEFDDIIPKDKEFEKGVAAEGWNNGMLTLDEAREKIGMEPAKKGKIYKSNFADMFIGEDEDRVELSSQAANLQYMTDPVPIDEDRNKIELLEMEEEKRILQRAEAIKAKKNMQIARELDNIRRQQSRKFEISLEKYLVRQSGEIRKRLTGTKAAGDIWSELGITQEEFNQLSKEEQESLTMGFVGGIFDWKSEEKILESLFNPLWQETYDKGADQIRNTYRLRSIQRPELSAAARLKGGQRVTRVTQTTKENIARIVAEGLESGKSNLTIADEIEMAMNTTSGRARVIAAQECNTSLLAGNFDMARKGGFGNKTWHVTNINKARDTHRELNGKTVPFDAPFVTSKGNRLMHPCDSDCNVAEETVNCHCFLTFS